MSPCSATFALVFLLAIDVLSQMRVDAGCMLRWIPILAVVQPDLQAHYDRTQPADQVITVQVVKSRFRRCHQEMTSEIWKHRKKETLQRCIAHSYLSFR